MFEAEARELGRFMAAHGITLIYGGGNKGIMGAIANAVLDGGGHVIGIIPHLLTQWEHQHNGITELLVVEDMHVRKRMLYEKCDAAIILPGGYGTLDELFEMLTWNQLSIHDKKMFILNTAGFYDPLMTHMRKMESAGFLYDSVDKRVVLLNSTNELEKLLFTN